MNHGFHVPRDPEHWSNGGTAITNFSEHMRPVYVEAVRRWGKGNLVVQQRPYGGVGESYGGSLHYVGRPDFHDLSDFWDIYRIVKAAMGLSELSGSASTADA